MYENPGGSRPPCPQLPTPMSMMAAKVVVHNGRGGGVPDPIKRLRESRSA